MIDHMAKELSIKCYTSDITLKKTQLKLHDIATLE